MILIHGGPPIVAKPHRKQLQKVLQLLVSPLQGPGLKKILTLVAGEIPFYWLLNIDKQMRNSEIPETCEVYDDLWMIYVFL
jgi:hypothetical protein